MVKLILNSYLFLEQSYLDIILYNYLKNIYKAHHYGQFDRYLSVD